MGYFTAEISQLFRVLESLKSGEEITTAEIWKRSRIQHTRGKPMLFRLEKLGFVKRSLAEKLERGINTQTKFWTITNDGKIFKEALELYVK